MKQNLIISLIAILTFAVLPAYAQLGSLKKIAKDKTKNSKPSPKSSSAKNLPNDPEYFYVGTNDLDKAKIGGLKVCSDNHKGKINWKNEFKQWFDEISPTAQLKMFERKRCDLMGFHVTDKPNRKYRKVDDLADRASGLSVYQVEDGKLVLVKKFATSGLYVVVVPQVAKSGLKLTDLNLAVKPDQKDHYRRKAKGVANYHNLKQSLYYLNQYKKYPGEFATNSVLYLEKDFQTLNKKGEFKPFVIFRLVGGKLEPLK